LGVKTPENKIEQECREEFQLSDFVQQKEKDTCSHQTVPWTLNRLKMRFRWGSTTGEFTALPYTWILGAASGKRCKRKLRKGMEWGNKISQNKCLATAFICSWFPSFQILGHIIKFPVSYCESQTFFWLRLTDRNHCWMWHAPASDGSSVRQD